MIKVHIDEGELKGDVVIAGGVTDLLADIYFLTSICYGSCAMKDKLAGRDFKLGFLAALTDEEMREKIFSTELAEALEKDGAQIKSTSADSEKEKERILKGLKELLDL